MEWRKAWRGLGGFRIGADHVEAGLGWGRVGVEIRSGRGEVWRIGTVCFFFGHLPAEIFKAISLCSFCRGCLKENDLSTVTGRGVDRIYIYIYYNQP